MTQEKRKGQKLPTDFDCDGFREEVIASLMQDQPLTGEQGLLKPLIADFIQGALDAELQDHLNQEKAQGISNWRNGKQNKQIRMVSGEVPIEYGPDRNGTFEPITIMKRDR